MNLADALPILLPKAIAWAAQQAAVAENAGVPLDAEGLSIARAVGVHEPERIRVVLCDEIPMPTESTLREAAAATGLLAPGTLGLTLGHALFIQQAVAQQTEIANEDVTSTTEGLGGVPGEGSRGGTSQRGADIGTQAGTSRGEEIGNRPGDDGIPFSTARESLENQTLPGVANNQFKFRLSKRLLAHECRHVYQVEQAGGLAPFLAEYLRQLLEFGYRDAPLEIDARRWEGTSQ